MHLPLATAGGGGYVGSVSQRGILSGGCGQCDEWLGIGRHGIRIPLVGALLFGIGNILFVDAFYAIYAHFHRGVAHLF